MQASNDNARGPNPEKAFLSRSAASYLLAALVFGLCGCGASRITDAQATGAQATGAQATGAQDSQGTSESGGTAISPADPPAEADPAATALGGPIQPMSIVDKAANTGYYSGPYLIRRAASGANAASDSFSGTTQAILTCPGNLSPGCFSQSAELSVDLGALGAQAKAAGSTVGGLENNNIFQDDSGDWHMATTFFVTNPNFPKDSESPWNVIAHAHPKTQTTSVPANWVCDTVLVGSLAEPYPANYDGKYFLDAGNLYLLYSKRVTTSPQSDGVVAQQMTSYTQLADANTVNMIVPTLTDNGYNSENKQINGGDLKLLETGNPIKINNKYAIIYSAGTYIQPNYKTAVAWSDTFLPASASGYTKVTINDSAGLWGQANHDEVLYLMQTQVSGWPGYVASQVLAPGVATLAQDVAGQYNLYFNGLDPNDAAIDPNTGMYVKRIRRVYYAPIKVNVPTTATVANTPSASLATWVTF